MRILLLIRALERGGAERQLVYLANGLAERGHDVAVAVFYRGGALEAELKTNVKLYSLEKKGRWDIVPFFLSLLRCVDDFRPDILHGYLGTSNLLTVPVKWLRRSIHTVWGVRASNVDYAHYGKLAALDFWLQCLLSRFADRIIANSHAGRNHMVAHGIPQDRIAVIHNGIDTSRFSPDRQSGAFLRGKWGCTEENVLFGLVARIDPMKGHRLFLQAASMVARTSDKARFVCVGDGPPVFREELHRFADTLGLENKLIWAGSCQDMPAVFNALDVCCLSSSFGEGFPNVLGEAMSCDIPCVATNVGDSAEIIDSTGVVVPPNNPKAFAGAMLEAQGLRKDEMTIPRKRIESSFSLGKLVTDTESLLLGILS